MTSTTAHSADPVERTARVVRVASWLTPLVLVANLIMIAGMGATTDDPGNLVRPFNWLGYAIDGATVAHLLAVGVAVVAASRFGIRGAVVARWSGRLALVLGIAILALFSWLLA